LAAPKPQQGVAVRPPALHLDTGVPGRRKVAEFLGTILPMKQHIHRISLALAILCLAGAVHAQSTPVKKELVARVLKLQQPGIEDLARSVAERPAQQMLQQASMLLLQRIPEEKREKLAKEIQADAQKFVDEVEPVITERAVKLAPVSIGTLLDEKFNEDELKQVIAFLESPVYKKYGDLNADMQTALVAKLVADTRATIEPKIKALDQSISGRLKAAAGVAADPAPAPETKKKK
jgi:uncharacterized protein